MYSTILEQILFSLVCSVRMFKQIIINMGESLKNYKSKFILLSIDFRQIHLQNYVVD